MIFFKETLKKDRNIKKILNKKKSDLSKLFNVRIEYLELRNKNNLKNSNKIKNSKLFIAYYIRKIRLIDNL